MAIDQTWTNQENFGGGNFGGSLLLHALVVGAIAGSAFLLHKQGDTWGGASAQAGAIQATMVSALPLPNTQHYNEKQMLTSETPSPAPVVTKEAAIEAPKPDAIPIPIKAKTPPKVAEKPTVAVKHPDPTPTPPTKAQVGETSGIKIAQSTVNVKNGTASVTVQDSTFGARYAYYVGVVNRTVAQNWFTQQVASSTPPGSRVTIIFDIMRDGTPINVRMGARSGSTSLDSSAMDALRRVEGFGPLPAGDHITVEYSFDYHP